MQVQKRIIIGAIVLLPMASLAQGGSSGSGDSGSGDRTRLASQSNLTLDEARQDFESARETARKAIDAKKDSARSEAEKKKDEICSRVSAKLAKRIDHGLSHRNEIDMRYNKVEARWQRLIDRAKAQNVDATKLEADLVIFKAKHAKIDADFEALAAALQNTTNDKCGYSNGDFKKSLSASKDLWTQIRIDRVDLRTFRQKVQQEDIVPLLKAIADAKGSASGSDDSSTATKTEKTQ